MKNTILNITVTSLLINFGYINGMWNQDPGKKVLETSLMQLKEDAKQISFHPNKNFDYSNDYFKSIADSIHQIQTSYPQLMHLIPNYKNELNFHAEKCLKQIIKNKNQSFNEKLESLQSYFPQNNPILSYYFEWGKEEINKQKVKDSETKELIKIQALKEKFQEKEHEYKIKLITDIIKSHPEFKIIESSDYTPDKFKNLYNKINLAKQYERSSINLESELYAKAIDFINLVATYPHMTLEDKLTYIEKHLSPSQIICSSTNEEICFPINTTMLLEETLNHNLKQIPENIKILQELPKLPKTEISKIEEKKEKPEFRIPTTKSLSQTPVLSLPVTNPRIQHEEYVAKIKQTQQPTGWIPYIWQGITNTINTIYYFSLWAMRGIKGILGMNND